MNSEPSCAARPLPVGLLVSSGLALVFFLVWTAFVQPGPDREPLDVDRRLAEGMKTCAEEHPSLRDCFVLITHLGRVRVMAALAALGVVGSFLLGYRQLALCWLLATAGGGLLNFGLKTLIDRPRPPELLRDAAVYEKNESYPSGHAMGSMVGLGMFACAGWLAWRRRDVRALLIGGTGVLVLSIGFSRIVLRAHWFSDVVAGFAVGASWLLACIAALEWLRRRDAASHASVAA